MSGEHENLNSNQRPTRLVDSDAHAQIHVSAPASEDLAAENGAPSAAEFSGLLYVPEASTPEAEKQLLSGPYYLGLSVVDSGPLAGLALSELGVVPIDPNTPIKDEKKEEMPRGKKSGMTAEPLSSKRSTRKTSAAGTNSTFSRKSTPTKITPVLTQPARRTKTNASSPQTTPPNLFW